MSRPRAELQKLLQEKDEIIARLTRQLEEALSQAPVQSTPQHRSDSGRTGAELRPRKRQRTGTDSTAVSVASWASSFSHPFDVIPNKADGYERRGSNSSSGSAHNISAFRECFSSSESEGDDEDDFAVLDDDMSDSGEEADAVQSLISTQTTALSAAQQHPKDAQTAVSALLNISEKYHGPGSRSIASSFQANKASLTGLLRLSDAEAEPTGILKPASPSTRLLLTLSREWDPNYIVEELLNQDDGVGVPASFLILENQLGGSRRKQDVTRPQPVSWWAYSFGLRARHGILTSPPESTVWIASLRLLRLLISAFWPGSSKPNMYPEIFRDLILLPQVPQQPSRNRSVRRVAIFQLASVFYNRPTPPRQLNQVDCTLRADLFSIIRDEEEVGAVRALALHTFSAVLEVGVGLEEQLKFAWADIAPLCVDVLLWKTNWQHNLSEDEAKFGIERLRPHDDAYAILCNFDATTFIRSLKDNLLATDKLSILEPIMALIVDQSALKGPDWPRMFSLLIHAGLVQYFHEIASIEVLNPDDRPLWRSITDALVGLMRCFEHMLLPELLAIKPEVFETLDRLAGDESLPLIVQRSATEARKTLHMSMVRVCPAAPNC